MTMATAANVVMVPMDAQLAGQYREYARAAGITFERAVHKGLDRWMEDTGSFVYEELVNRQQGCKPSNVVPFPGQ